MQKLLENFTVEYIFCCCCCCHYVKSDLWQSHIAVCTSYTTKFVTLNRTVQRQSGYPPNSSPRPAGNMGFSFLCVCFLLSPRKTRHEYHFQNEISNENKVARGTWVQTHNLLIPSQLTTKTYAPTATQTLGYTPRLCSTTLIYHSIFSCCISNSTQQVPISSCQLNFIRTHLSHKRPKNDLWSLHCGVASVTKFSIVTLKSQNFPVLVNFCITTLYSFLNSPIFLMLITEIQLKPLKTKS